MQDPEGGLVQERDLKLAVDGKQNAAHVSTSSCFHKEASSVIEIDRITTALEGVPIGFLARWNCILLSQEDTGKPRKRFRRRAF